MKRHLLVTNDFPPKVGGIQNYLWDLWSRLDPASFVVLTATSDDEAESFDAAQAARGVRIERVPGSILFFPTPKVRRDIDDCVRRHGVDLVLLDPALPLGLLGPHLDVPYGVILHGAEVAVPARLPGPRSALARVLGDASIVISAGRYPAAEGRRVTSELATPLLEIPPGVETAGVAPLDAKGRRAARTQLGLPAAAPLLASVSRLVPRKGMDVLIEAANRLAPSYPDLVVAIAGDGRERRRLERMAAESTADVRILGRLGDDDRATLLGAADVFVMACRNRWGGLEQEGFGIVFLEAAAFGVPQIAGDSGGASEAVLDGVTGLVADDPSDPGTVAEAIRTLLADPPLRRRMGRAARTRVRESFDIDVLASRLAEALAGVAI
ncbi:MAG TPA: glycosyltransferase family 4 protein [Acidimicrobiales bacterium]|jgi:phosphatidylinositol alpha-1,6-mannosyltransferase|nr:glycosyltransferase family 4 protein [Acidimicrobiales bacterium]